MIDRGWLDKGPPAEEPAKKSTPARKPKAADADTETPETEPKE